MSVGGLASSGELLPFESDVGPSLTLIPSCEESLTGTQSRCAGRVPPQAENLAKGPAEAAVAERVQEWVYGGVEPQQPEGDLVPVMLDAAPSAGGADDHQEGVRRPADGKHAYDDGQGLGNFLVPGQAAGMDTPAG